MNIQKSIIYGLLLFIAQSSKASYSTLDTLCSDALNKEKNEAVISWAYDYNDYYHPSCQYISRKDYVISTLKKICLPVPLYIATYASLQNYMIKQSTLNKTLILATGTVLLGKAVHYWFYKPYSLEKTSLKLLYSNTPKNYLNIITKAKKSLTSNGVLLGKKGIFVQEDAINSNFNQNSVFHPLPESKSLVSQIRKKLTNRKKL